MLLVVLAEDQLWLPLLLLLLGVLYDHFLSVFPPSVRFGAADFDFGSAFVGGAEAGFGFGIGTRGAGADFGISPIENEVTFFDSSARRSFCTQKRQFYHQFINSFAFRCVICGARVRVRVSSSQRVPENSPSQKLC